MSYQVVLPEFEGPLDLLLHLIDVHELDIYDIPIAFITGQYMDYLRKAEEIDLNLSGDFMVMAGTLLVIKAKMLLPKRVSESIGGESLADPRDELMEKLLEYRLYKENALDLQKLESSRTKVYFREINEKHLLSLFPQPNPIGKLKSIDLHRSFQEIMQLYIARGKYITLPKDETSLQDKMEQLLDTLAQGPIVSFTQLMGGCASVMEAVTLFLALLELLGKGLIWIRQDDLFEEIFVSLERS